MRILQFLLLPHFLLKNRHSYHHQNIFPLYFILWNERLIAYGSIIRRRGSSFFFLVTAFWYSGVDSFKCSRRSRSSLFFFLARFLSSRVGIFPVSINISYIFLKIAANMSRSFELALVFQNGNCLHIKASFRSICVWPVGTLKSCSCFFFNVKFSCSWTRLALISFIFFVARYWIREAHLVPVSLLFWQLCWNFWNESNSVRLLFRTVDSDSFTILRF